jgi:hypothetical protein
MGRRLRIVAAGSIVLAPLGFGIVDQLRMMSVTPADVGPAVGAVEEYGLEQEVARLAEIQANPGFFTAAATLEYVMFFVAIVAFVAIWRLAVDRAPRWAWAAAGLSTVAAFGLVTHLSSYFGPSMVAAGQEDLTAAAAFLLAMGESPFMLALIVPFLLGTLLTPVVQGIALRRARVVPLWAPFAIVAGTLLIAMTGSQRWSSAIYSLLLVAGFAPAALAMLRRDHRSTPPSDLADRPAAGTTERGTPRRRRILVGMLTLAFGVVLAGPAAAEPPERQRVIDDQRWTYQCGDVAITEDGGHYVTDTKEKGHADGRVRTTYVATARQVTASDEDGNRYRISGSASGTVVSPDAGEDPLREQIGFRFTIRHADGGGLVGRLWMRIQVRPDGTVTFTSRGDCMPE